MRSIFIVSVFFCTLLLTSCNTNTTTDNNENQSAKSDITALRKIIDEKNKQFGEAHVLRDTAFLNNIFTEDARVFAPNSEIISGRSAIAIVNLETVNFGINEFRIEKTALYGSGDYLINEGNYIMSYGKDSTTERGKFIFIWKMVNGDWKLDADIWNSSMTITPTK